MAALDDLLSELADIDSPQTDTKMPPHAAAPQPASQVPTRQPAAASWTPAAETAARQRTSHGSHANGRAEPTGGSGGHSHVDDLLSMMEDVDTVPEPGAGAAVSVAAPTAAFTGAPSRSSRSRCARVYLGDATAPQGCATSVKKLSCSTLRCTACDFTVERFPGRKWATSAEYIFFRNHMPNRDKLSGKLVAAPRNVMAYCCQCCWVSVGEGGWDGSQVPPKGGAATLLPTGDKGGVVPLSSAGGLPSPFATDTSLTSWVCGGHG